MKFLRNKRSFLRCCGWALALFFCGVAGNASARDVSIHVNANVVKCFPDIFERDVVDSGSLYPFVDLGELSFSLVFKRNAELFQEARYKVQCELYAEVDRDLSAVRETLIQDIERSGEAERGVWSRDMRNLFSKQSPVLQEIEFRLNLAVADEAARFEKWAIASATYLGLVDTYLQADKLQERSLDVPNVYPDQYLLGMATKGFEITRPLALKEQGRQEDGMTDYFNELKTKVDVMLRGEDD